MDTVNKKTKPLALIARVLSGEALAPEKQELQNWIDANPAHAEGMHMCQQIWQSPLNARLDFDVEISRKQKVYGNVMAHIASGNDAVRLARHHRMRSLVAAVIVLVFFSLFITWQLARPLVFIAERRQDVWLVDSSRIVLEKNTVLSLDRKRDHVDASIRGEAFIELTGKQVARIRVESASIEATRATFSIHQVKSGRVIAVMSGSLDVRSGSVRRTLLPGQQFAISSDQRKPSI